ncbi:hypothetical protein MERGE_001440 [Pneumocystis wakefieldiae]|uniref:Uncharacterized protein n=1 Tax=Pneumocystis wakefieldiae TaxID=38082 RepID=A0A899G2R7_9ASCO|nr:hypothetical protein MERGE_001440 [Pneumocystis wakefieldiae]
MRLRQGALQDADHGFKGHFEAFFLDPKKNAEKSAALRLCDFMEVDGLTKRGGEQRQKK